MAAYIFYQGTLPTDYTTGYEGAIFNLPAFQSLHDAGHWRSFYVLHEKRKQAVAGCHFHLQHQQALSPLRAPFGSVEFSSSITPRILFEFLEYIEAQLKKEGVTEVTIKNPPNGYAYARLSLLETFLLNQRYVITDAEVSALIQVKPHAFNEVIRNSEKLRLQQAIKAGLVFHALPADRVDEVYLFLVGCHTGKGYNISITLATLKSTMALFPDRYLLFAVMHEGRMVSASISIRIQKNILYNFFANHERAYDALSPFVLLVDGIYAYCRANHIPLLDLGTSAWEGKPNFKLLDFKLHIGGLAASKLTFYKRLV